MSVHPSALPQNGSFSVCIVGAGPVGIATAVELSSRGIRTILLEAGDARARPQARTNGALIAEAQSVQHSPDSETVGRGLGGTSSRWGGRCVEFDDIDFERRDFADADGWPISHADLKSYYPRARRLLSSDLEENEVKSEIKSAFNLSVETWARERNTAIVNYQHLRICKYLEVIVNCEVTEINFCSVTDRVQSLTIVSGDHHRSITADFFVLAAGGRGCTRLLLNLQADFPALFGGRSGPLGRYYMGHVAGEIAEIAFANKALAEQYTFRRTNNGTLVRNRFQPSSSLQRSLGLQNIVLWPNGSDNSRLVWGDPACSVRYLASRTIRRRTRPENLNAATISDHIRNILAFPVSAVGGTVRRLSNRHIMTMFQSQFLASNQTNTYLLRYHAEQLANAESCVCLAASRDRNGVRMLDTNFHFKKRDYISVITAHQELDNWLRCSGIGHLEYLVDPSRCEDFIASQAKDGYHQIGLNRMGSNRLDGVVDANGKVFDVVNLYVAGSSIFRSSGQANPTLPAVAFAVRLSHHLHALMSGLPAEIYDRGAGTTALKGAVNRSRALV